MNYMAGRTLAIGDIHGSLVALETLAQEMNFSKEDTLIFLGDYVDRGPQSKGVLDWLMDHQEKLNIITLKGNHEIMMLDAIDDLTLFSFWAMNGGIETLHSFGCLPEEIDRKYLDFMDNCQLYHETKDHIFIHAGCVPDLPLDAQGPETLCWLRFRNLKAHQSNKVIICGHTPQSGNIPGILPYAVCIDTHAFAPNGFLTCLDANSGDYFQANSQGDFLSKHICMP